jgi:glycosyltransferase involved in cell wall biosynthesis
MSAFLQAKTVICKIRPDVLHAHYVTDYGFIGALTNFHPLVVSVWGSDVLIAPQKSKVSRLQASFTLKRADCITTTAEFMKRYLVKKFALPQDKIVRVPWGIDLEIFHLGYAEEAMILRKSLGVKANAPIVLSNRNMAPQYEIESIIDAIPYVLKEHPNAVFIFIRGYGYPEFEEKMKRKAQQLKVYSNTFFIPRTIPPIEMAVYLNMAEMIVSIPKCGQFGASILEGMICGAVPIVSNISVHREVLIDGKNGYLVNSDNPKHIAEVIIDCIKNPRIKQQFYNRNKEIIEQEWDWKRNAERMVEVYDELARRRY